MIVWLNNIELIDYINLLILFGNWNQVLEIKRNDWLLSFHPVFVKNFNIVNYFNCDYFNAFINALILQP